MRTHLLVTLAAVVVLSVTATGWLSTEASERKADGPNVRKALAFTLEDLEGNKVSFSEFRGKIVVLEWMNYDCPYSRRHYERGTFKEIYGKYKNGLPGGDAEPDPPQPARRKRKPKGPQVVWLAINSTHYATKEQMKAFAQKHKVPYPILDDHRGRVGRVYGIETTPHILIKNRDGTIAYEGAVDNDEEGRKEEPLNYVDQALREILEGKEVSVPKTKPYGRSIEYAKRR